MSPSRDGTTSVAQLKDQRLSVYCSPRFCRRSRFLETACLNSMLEKKDEIGWLRAFDPRHATKTSPRHPDAPRSKSANGILPHLQRHRRKCASQSTNSQPSSSDTDSLGCVHPMANLDLTSPAITTNDTSSPDSPPPPKPPGTPTLLPKRPKQRPVSLALLDNHATTQSLDSNANGDLVGSACCSLHVRRDRNAADRSPAGSARAIPTSSKSLNPPSCNPLSKSCSDLRGGALDECCMIHPNFTCRCPSHLSLQSARVSTPSESRTGSRISLLSEGVDSYEGLYEKAYRATYVMDRERLVHETKVSPDRLVREWLARQEEISQQTPETQEVQQ